MDIMKLYNDWCSNANEDKDLITELKAIENDDKHEEKGGDVHEANEGL